MNTIDLIKIDKYLSKPIYIQVALDVKWDKAWKLPLTEHLPNTGDIANFLAQGGEKLAFKLFYETNYGGKFLIGSYFTQTETIATMDAFLATVFDIVFNRDISKASVAIEHLNSELGNAEKLFHNNCTDLELGILDFWRFYPACTLLEGAYTLKDVALASKLENFPSLQYNKDNTALLELVCDYNPLHFVGFTVSDKVGDTYTVNTALITEIIQDLLS